MSIYTQSNKYQLPVNEKKCLETVVEVEDGIFLRQCRNLRKYGDFCYKHRKEKK